MGVDVSSGFATQIMLLSICDPVSRDDTNKLNFAIVHSKNCQANT